ncbi:MAG TPA: class I SAM-dependent methyltransferase [Aliiroseovarius sp.]|nr:class I SAM-dependent methyltransferase [Aliiroseovarius sp.]
MGAVAKFWDRAAKRYAAAEIKDVESHERRLATIEALLGPDMRVLDMAAGSGALDVRLSPRAGTIDAVDISPKMVEIARQRAAEAKVFNTRFTCAAIEDLTPPEFKYDAVLAMSILHLLDDWRGAIAKAYDLLRPGGLFISNTHCIEGEKRRLKFFVRVGVPLGIMPNLQVFGKEAFLAAIRDAGFVIEEEWQKAPKKPVFVVARKPA